jgi:hypothetical protein
MAATAVISVFGMANAASSAPFDGSSAATAGLSAAQILADGYSVGNGLYWIDPDGAGAGAAFQVYADMTTAGGGWMLVRRNAGSGGFIGITDNLAGTQAINTGLSTDKNSALAWSIAWQSLGMDFDRFLFMTGDETAWGVLGKADVFATNSDYFNLNAEVLASSGVGVAAGGFTNVTNRPANPEDPWIGFEGDHFANINAMFYGENGVSIAAHNSFKNLHGGANVFIREDNVVTTVESTPTPEPAAALLLGAGLAGLGYIRRRRAA